MNWRFKAAATICFVFSSLESTRLVCRREERREERRRERRSRSSTAPPLVRRRCTRIGRYFREWNATLCASAILKWSEAKWSNACDQHRSAWEHSSAVQYSTVQHSMHLYEYLERSVQFSAMLCCVLFSAVSPVMARKMRIETKRTGMWSIAVSVSCRMHRNLCADTRLCA